MNDNSSELHRLNAAVNTLQAKIVSLEAKVYDLDDKLLNKPNRIDEGVFSAVTIKAGNIVTEGKIITKEEK